MIEGYRELCPKCCGKLKYYDSVKRLVIGEFRNEHTVVIRRLKCSRCGKLHRELPEFIFPYKHYEKDVIIGVVEGLITYETLGFEDYPCDMTVGRWKRAFDISKIVITD